MWPVQSHRTPGLECLHAWFNLILCSHHLEALNNSEQEVTFSFCIGPCKFHNQSCIKCQTHVVSPSSCHPWQIMSYCSGKLLWPSMEPQSWSHLLWTGAPSADTFCPCPTSIIDFLSRHSSIIPEENIGEPVSKSPLVFQGAFAGQSQVWRCLSDFGPQPCPWVPWKHLTICGPFSSRFNQESIVGPEILDSHLGSVMDFLSKLS